MAIGYIKKKLVEGVETLVPETTAGPSAGTVRKLSFDCNIDYAVPITADETGEGYVGVSGNCKVTFNPKCNIGTVADPEYIGVLKADCFCGKGQSTNISDCVEISSVNNNVNYKVPFTCDCEVLNACSQNLLYNPSTGLLTTNCICSNNEIEAACEIRAGEFCSRTVNKGITAATTSEGNTVNHNGDIIYKGCDGELATSGCCQFTYNPSTGTLCVNHVVAIDDVTKTICCAFTNAADERITACVSANSGYLHTLVNCSDGNISLGRYCECVTPSSKCVSTDGSVSCCVFGSGGFNTTCETNASFRKDICNTSNSHLTRVNVDNTGVNLISQGVCQNTLCFCDNLTCNVVSNCCTATCYWCAVELFQPGTVSIAAYRRDGTYNGTGNLQLTYSYAALSTTGGSLVVNHDGNVKSCKNFTVTDTTGGSWGQAMTNAAFAYCPSITAGDVWYPVLAQNSVNCGIWSLGVYGCQGSSWMITNSCADKFFTFNSDGSFESLTTRSDRWTSRDGCVSIYQISQSLCCEICVKAEYTGFSGNIEAHGVYACAGIETEDLCVCNTLYTKYICFYS